MSGRGSLLMAVKKTPAERDRQAQIVAEARRYQAEREQTYRAQALKLYPWICARCGREFSGKKLRELTVHHKDHNHDNNPPDGSNWELLCLYCHVNDSLVTTWQKSTCWTWRTGLPTYSWRETSPLEGESLLQCAATILRHPRGPL